MSETTAFIERQGGPEVIEWREVELPPPGPGEVRMRNTAVGLNFIDTYHRGGLYPVTLPSGLGMEAAGLVEAVGQGVTGFAPGDRVCTFMGPGAYATARNLPAAALFRIPDGVSDEIAAAALLKACTVEALVERCARVEAGWPVLVHAAAGGVGLVLVQWLKHVGAKVIGTVSTDAKAEAAREAGAEHVIRYDRDAVAPKVRELTGGNGVRAIFDGVGKDTWQASLDSAAPRAIIVSFGNASGAVEGVNLGVLAQKGSLFVTRPTLFDYYRVPGEAAAGVGRVFDLIRNGVLTVTIGQTYPLREAARAHRDLEARSTTGSTILIP
ncbi:quinone oxidoreductase [Novosphingobium sp. Gsoil 351]|uniref:quinone oxidoreductase family protein n=1 Tax=Novosphingobium sp. Gsoil 351 TaxID=2675225 RepID=UPI0012B44767|nr:quinone oxidoreductase [Novosphingobium sp. Gsoil 351]QGN54826.1 zinc-binding dehydrogenase [Novosphingobium sp. Gsoil 351]